MTTTRMPSPTGRAESVASKLRVGDASLLPDVPSIAPLLSNHMAIERISDGSPVESQDRHLAEESRQP